MKRFRKPSPFIKYIYLGIFLLVTAVIFLFSLTNGTESSQQSNFFRDIVVNSLNFFGITLSPDQVDLVGLLIRKLIGHLGIFAVDGFFGFLTFYSFLKKEQRVFTSFIFSIIVMLVIAFLSEGMQFLVPDRGPAFVDVAIDFSGALIAIFAVFLCKRHQIKKEKAL